MNTLLIVEDNDFERNALLHYVDWDVLGVRVVDTAINGKDGLEKARQHHPDMILSDVMMPVMDGIEMAKAIVQTSPNTKFIFSSGHEDIGLLKEALEVRAYSYLTKPLRQEELIASLRKIAAVSMDEKLSHRANRKMLEQFQSNLQHLQTKFLEELMYGAIKPEDAGKVYTQVSDLKLQMTGSYKLALIDIDFVQDADIFDKSSRLNAVLTELRRTIGPTEALFVKDGDSRIAAILHSLKDDPEREGRILHMIEVGVTALMEAQAFRYVIGLSGDAPNLTDLSLLYRQCCATLFDKIGFGYGRVISFEQARVTAERAESDHERIKQLTREIAAAACEGHPDEEGVQKLLTLAANEPLRKLERIQSVAIGLMSQLSKELESKGENAEAIMGDETALFERVLSGRTLPDVAVAVRQTIQLIAVHRGRKKLSKEDYIVQQVLTIIQTDFHLPITLAYLSERVFLSSNYLRILFKEKMEISIQDYLTQFRINKAKELLVHSRRKIQEIGELVGYENGTYFNLVFKNNVNMTPGEYRSKHMTQVNGA